MIQVTKLMRNGKFPFDERFKKIKDHRAKSRITARLTRVAMGNFGECRQLDERLFELKIDVGTGWRVYFTKQGDKVILLMLLGDKARQVKDIKEVRRWINELNNENRSI
ncbi:MAG: type II toxin-antitoxin system RelE/ParE family toxin [Thiomicrorhabdus sp.]|nr:type II toxin-antitoxin system RelE/ParE family toxin [Thiomicrorhabdus sp.]MCF6299376.1 type II toxin-antitoxin system RelE/ParE family toxin [Thiomicrorhabdus sp.]